jgi:rod shape-determining protein MreC
MLPTDGNSKIPVAIGSVHAVAVGSFGSQILLQKVGQTDLIQKDDLVVTSGEGDSYFPGLVVGRISKITGRETDLFRQAEVVPLLDLNRLTTVFVITDK